MDLAFHIDSTEFVSSVLDRVMLVSVAARKRENLNQQSSTFDSRRIISVLNSLSPFAPEKLV